WSHIYFYDPQGLLRKRLTSGEWAATRIARVDEKTGWVWFLARVGRSTETHLCRVNIDGSGFELLTKEPGTHRSILSPAGSYFLDTFSSLTSPPRQDLYAGDGTFIGNIDQSRTPQYAEYGLGRTELFTIRTDDGWDLPAVWVLPPDFDPAKKYPVLFSVYGGPGVANVTNAALPLSAYFLAQEGLIWLRVDHRGSGHFGKKGTALMHRNLGAFEMRDWIAAVKWLRTKPFVDPDRVGITGGSYGGYATCLALTYGSDYFTHGLATSPVTDWRLYDSVYAERYMDTPAENPAGYDAASILTHAVKLKGVLFLVHGEIDDNVHLQNTVQLIDRLTDLGKPFGFMLYPGERHGLDGKKREHASRLAVDFWSKHFFGR
ncbi:MAG: prolyl oligopeptidase family serine peptidase, partial [Candidatus Aminicenantes bacterium]|nr:prolyl oligopeptidase family serine peptidase [Candidatus Aminicenantes bacterium]